MQNKHSQITNYKIIIKRTNQLTQIEFAFNWIIFIAQEYLMHSWFFFISILTYLILNIIEIHILGYSRAIIPFKFSLLCSLSFFILIVATIYVYGIEFIIILLFLQLPILIYKLRIRKLFSLSDTHELHPHIQLDTSHCQ